MVSHGHWGHPYLSPRIPSTQVLPFYSYCWPMKKSPGQPTDKDNEIATHVLSSANEIMCLGVAEANDSMIGSLEFEFDDDGGDYVNCVSDGDPEFDSVVAENNGNNDDDSEDTLHSVSGTTGDTPTYYRFISPVSVTCPPGYTEDSYDDEWISNSHKMISDIVRIASGRWLPPKYQRRVERDLMAVDMSCRHAIKRIVDMCSFSVHELPDDIEFPNSVTIRDILALDKLRQRLQARYLDALYDACEIFDLQKTHGHKNYSAFREYVTGALFTPERFKCFLGKESKLLRKIRTRRDKTVYEVCDLECEYSEAYQRIFHQPPRSSRLSQDPDSIKLVIKEHRFELD